ncbi:MAG: hypothetical protein UIG59_07230 [Acutalibacteraceae bacterium]|nr:hypothetical protein [Acutalibacteraceae bacterium]
MIFSLQSVNVNAETHNTTTEQVVSTTTAYLDDGTIIEIIIYEEFQNVMPISNTYTKTGIKTYNCKNSDGTVLWWFKLSGQFDVNEGVSSVCTSSWYSHSILNNNWSLKSASTSESSNKAMAEATFIRKVLFITAETKDISLTLTCDKNGNLS